MFFFLFKEKVRKKKTSPQKSIYLSILYIYIYIYICQFIYIYVYQKKLWHEKSKCLVLLSDRKLSLGPPLTGHAHLSAVVCLYIEMKTWPRWPGAVGENSLTLKGKMVSLQITHPNKNQHQPLRQICYNFVVYLILLFLKKKKKSKKKKKR